MSDEKLMEQEFSGETPQTGQQNDPTTVEPSQSAPEQLSSADNANTDSVEAHSTESNSPDQQEQPTVSKQPETQTTPAQAASTDDSASTHTEADADMSMDPDDDEDDVFTEQEMEEMNKLLDKSMPSFGVGEIIKGRVLKVTSEDVVVDIGSKSEGIVPLKEFLQDGKDPNVFVGMEVDVMVIQRENQDGHPVLSRLRAKERKAKAMAREAFESGDPVECRVQEILKGGFQVDVDGLRGFIPFSQMGPHSRTPEQQQALIGQRIKAKIIEMRGRRDLILSQRAFIEEERDRPPR